MNRTEGNKGNEEKKRKQAVCVSTFDPSHFLPGLCVGGVLFAFMLHSTIAAPSVEWLKAEGYRAAQLSVPQKGQTGFAQVPAAATRILFTNYLSEARVAHNRVLDNGSGVALGDVDSDGFCDIYFCRLEGPNALYRNLGHWKFEDVTAKAGVACANDLSTAAVLADLDGDSDLDLLVNSIGGGTRCFLNDGTARFTELTMSGLQRKFGSTSLALADVDGDGDLDLYVTNYRTDTYRDSPPHLKIQYEVTDGKVVIRPEDRFYGVMKGKDGFMLIERGEADFLYLNNGQGRFTPVSWSSGTFRDEDGQLLAAPPQYWGLSAMFRDINGDGAPDLYVCNDFRFSPDQIWINDGQGRFQALPRLAMRNMSMSSMGVDFADINRDGHVDFVVVDMLSRDHRRRHTQRVNVHPDLMALPFAVIDNRPEVMRNTLNVNRGDSTFAEIAQFAGLQASEWSWCPIFLDVDLDGYEDLLISTGNGHDVIDSDGSARLDELTKRNPPGKPLKALPHFPALLTPSFAFRNRGDLTFEDVSRAWGFDWGGVSHGMALADLDNDGDLDVVVNNLNAPAGIYRNESIAPRLAVRLKGASPNTSGIGATIKVMGAQVTQSQEMICGGRYLSGDDSVRVFATGTLTNKMRVEVTWRSGRRSAVTNAQPNWLYEIEETRALERPSGAASERSSGSQDSPRSTLFQDASHLLNHTHHEEPFDDFARQPLLPNRLSQLGPGVCWQDFDGDGWDDLIIGSGKGGHLSVFRNLGDGKFTALNEPAVNRPVARDQTAVVGFGSNLLAGSANYEDGLTNGGWIRIYDLNRKASGDSILGPSSSTGPLALADIDGDGDLDLFIGGRVIAGRYPEPATSMILKNEGGRFVVARRWDKLGLVSGATFSDLDGDGNPELILACEWGPIHVFRNERGTFTPWNWPVTTTNHPSALHASRFTLHDFTGWWNGVTTGDFDGDGRLDIV
ncbi:MAG: VCBS repeat-containing protein, partial [Verrucomicrobia bacterium]|nr:VCBS repeat-containing protein [Verrucomicrobiota bacterium]